MLVLDVTLHADGRALVLRGSVGFAEFEVRRAALERRFVVAGRQVAAALRYKTGAALDVAAGAPEGAWAAAAVVARHPWRPADVFVAVIAETDGRYRPVELNTFGTAGLYACDLAAVVRAVAPYAA